MNAQTQEFINTTIQVLLASMWVAIPIMFLLIFLYIYQGYKKRKNDFKEKPERIIVKVNREQGFDSYMISGSEEQMKHFFSQLDKYIATEEKAAVIDASEPKPYEAMKVEELREIAKSKGLRGSSRWSKDKLLLTLKDIDKR